MKIVDTTCKKCGANLHIDAGCKSAFCEYCGAQILIDDEVQHMQIDNAESAGYEFEKGRQRAQQEAQMLREYSAPPVPKKNKKMLWWVLGWIFIFPIPLTILIARNQKLKTGVKIGIISAAWSAYLLIGIGYGTTKNTREDTEVLATQTSYSIQETTIFEYAINH